MMDLKSADPQEIIECVGKSGAVVVMAPPSSGPANSSVSILYAALKPKQVSFEFTAHGVQVESPISVPSC